MTEGPADGVLAVAADALRAGLVVAIPTDTVYGVAVDPDRPGATARLFALKGRPPGVALPVLVADGDQAAALAGAEGWSAGARRLAGRYWPGALTLVVPRRRGLDWDLGGDPGTVGLRCPASAEARALCRAVGPLATTSANRHGEPPCQTAAEVTAVFGPELLVVDGGRGEGVPSTVVDLTGATPSLLRQGALSFEEVLGALGEG